MAQLDNQTSAHQERSAESKLAAWQHHSLWPMVVLSVIYVLAYVLPVYFYFQMSQFWKEACATVVIVTWIVFVLDYIIQISLSQQRMKFIRSEWLTVLFLVLPFFRPIRAIRGIIMIRQGVVRDRSMISSLPWILALVVLLLVLIMGAAELETERFVHGANITTPGAALWWAFNTLTTSGSQYYPITDTGKVLGAVLSICGLGVIASMTGLIAAWVVHQFKIETSSSEQIH